MGQGVNRQMPAQPRHTDAESLPSNISETSNGVFKCRMDDKHFNINPSMSFINPKSKGNGWTFIVNDCEENEPPKKVGQFSDLVREN